MLGHNGLISFSEYLFLLTILTKPQSGFKIAFAMLDRNGDGKIDKDEYMVIETVYSSAKEAQNTKTVEQDEQQAESVRNTSCSIDKFVPVRSNDNSNHMTNTSLLTYFFGKKVGTHAQKVCKHPSSIVHTARLVGSS